MKIKKVVLAIVVGLFTLGSVVAQDHHNHKHSPTENRGSVYVCPMHPEVTGAKGSNCPKCGMTLVKKVVKPHTYTCSMHPEVESDKPGACSKCGMKLIEKKEKEEDHSGHNH